jgi:hypothetical protein
MRFSLTRLSDNLSSKGFRYSLCLEIKPPLEALNLQLELIAFWAISQIPASLRGKVKVIPPSLVIVLVSPDFIATVGISDRLSNLILFGFTL